MTNRIRSGVIACVLICLALSAAGFAATSSDVTHFGSDITIDPGHDVGEATCFGCTVHVRGHVAGDVTVIGGNVVVEDQGQIGGDTTAFLGGVRLEKNVKVSGDLTVFGGRIRLDPTASIGGETTNFAGIWWILLICGLPLAFMGGFVFLIVWVVRRLTRPGIPVTA
jgi:UDP-3-O-[3-hydroxymyristoyl] glucosamine N-acyltransferase